ncbi:MAG: AAA family ATPase [Rikenellaceae bacterium]
MSKVDEIGAELKKGAGIDPSTISEKLKSAEVHITDEYAEPDPLLTCCMQLVLSRGNIMMVTGKPKAFKTFFTSAVASAIIEDSILNMSGGDNVKSVLFIDTEQSKGHCHKVLSRIYRLCGWDLTKVDNRLTMLSLREQPNTERLQSTLQAIETYHPDIVILDGIRDIVVDFNSSEESSRVIGQLMAYSTIYNCGILCVLHQNKADNNARGHLGTEGCNKSETVLQIVNNGGIASVEPIYCRNREFDSFNFRVNEQGLPELCDPPKVEPKRDELCALMTKAMFGSSWIARKELETKIMTITGKAIRTAQRKIADAITANVLKINKAGYLILVDNVEVQEDLLI